MLRLFRKQWKVHFMSLCNCEVNVQFAWSLLRVCVYATSERSDIAFFDIFPTDYINHLFSFSVIIYRSDWVSWNYTTGWNLLCPSSFSLPCPSSTGSATLAPTTRRVSDSSDAIMRPLYWRTNNSIKTLFFPLETSSYSSRSNAV